MGIFFENFINEIQIKKFINNIIGGGSIIGANSLVKNKFPNNCTIVGVPGKLKHKDIAWDREEINPNLINNKTYWNKTIE